MLAGGSRDRLQIPARAPARRRAVDVKRQPVRVDDHSKHGLAALDRDPPAPADRRRAGRRARRRPLRACAGNGIARTTWTSGHAAGLSKTANSTPAQLGNP